MQFLLKKERVPEEKHVVSMVFHFNPNSNPAVEFRIRGQWPRVTLVQATRVSEPCESVTSRHSHILSRNGTWCTMTWFVKKAFDFSCLIT